MVNYVSQFMPHVATITALHRELSGNAEWLWMDLQEVAFEAVKPAADNHQVLRPMDYNKPDMTWLFTARAMLEFMQSLSTSQRPTKNTAEPAYFFQGEDNQDVRNWLTACEDYFDRNPTQ